jgi:NAD-dependent SIR2 family protein deacetylase
MDTTKYRDTECWYCGDDIDPKRVDLLKADKQPMRCMSCGEEAAILARKSWCIAPMHKSNYMLFTQKADLVGINNKGGLVK